MLLSNKNIVIGRDPDQIKKTKKLLENHDRALQGNAVDSKTTEKGIKLELLPSQRAVVDSEVDNQLNRVYESYRKSLAHLYQ